MIFSASVGLVVVCPGCWHYSIPGTALILLPSLCWLHPMTASTYLHNIYISKYLHIYTVLKCESRPHRYLFCSLVLQCSVTLKCSEMIMFRLGLIWAIKRSIVPHFSAEINCILMQKQWKLLMFRCCSYFKNAILHIAHAHCPDSAG